MSRTLYTTSALTSSDKTLLKSRKLLDKAERAPLKYLDELALHLARESDLETVARALDAIESSSVSADGPPSPELIAYVTRAMMDFGVIVQALHKARKLGNVQAFSDLAMPLIFEKWAGVVRWLTHLLSQVSLGGRSSVATMCCEVLRGAIEGATEDPYREEIAMRDCTIDLIFFLLCQKDDKGFYLHLPQRADRACAILSLFRGYFQNTSMREAIDHRLHCRSHRIIAAILKALVGRARNIVERATTRATVVGCIKSLSFILEGIDQFMTDPALWKILHREDFLGEFTAAFLVLVERGTSWDMSQDDFVWRAVVNCFYTVCHSSMFSPGSPRSSVVRLMNAGLLPCAHICLSRILNSHTVYTEHFRGIITNMLPYLFTGKTRDVIDHTWSPYDVQLKGYQTQSSYKWQGCNDLIVWIKTIRYIELRRHDHIALCSNLQHSARTESIDPEQGDVAAIMKECRRCHTVMYCSAECQEMDWPMHSKECRALAEVYYGEKEYGTWVSARSKADYLILLETRTYTTIASPTQLLADPRRLKGVPRARSTEPPLLTYQEDFSVSVIDFSAFGDKPLAVNCLSMEALMTCEWRLEGVMPWLSRLQQFIQSVEAEMDQLILVEGYFRLNEAGKALMIVALMRYYTGLDDRAGYKVVNSFFSVVNRGYHK